MMCELIIMTNKYAKEEYAGLLFNLLVEKYPEISLEQLWKYCMDEANEDY